MRQVQLLFFEKQIWGENPVCPIVIQKTQLKERNVTDIDVVHVEKILRFALGLFLKTHA